MTRFHSMQPTHVHGDAEAMLKRLFPDPAAKLSEFGDYMSTAVRIIVDLTGCAPSEAMCFVREHRLTVLDRFKALRDGPETAEFAGD